MHTHLMGKHRQWAWEKGSVIGGTISAKSGKDIPYPSFHFFRWFCWRNPQKTYQTKLGLSINIDDLTFLRQLQSSIAWHDHFCKTRELKSMKVILIVLNKQKITYHMAKSIKLNLNSRLGQRILAKMNSLMLQGT